jgi:uncharacterized delta-60 repeat protein
MKIPDALQILRQNPLCPLILLTLFLTLNQAASASAGDLDPSFGNSGKVNSPIGKASTDYGLATARQPDGKIIVAGRVFDGIYSNFMISRLNGDGTLDTTFGANGTAVKTFYTTNYAFAIAIQPDGKIIAGGFAPPFVFANAQFVFTLVRFNSDGSSDNSFGTGGIVQTDFGLNSAASSLALQSDGKIVAGGFIYGNLGINGGISIAAARYNIDGTPDNTFDGDGKMSISFPIGQNARANAVAIQPDNKILLGGTAQGVFKIARLNADGTLDTTGFGTNGIASTAIGTSSNINALTLQPDGKIVAAGRSSNGSNDDVAVVRYTSSGVPDTTFDGDGIVTTNVDNRYDVANAVSLQTDGKIVIGGISGQTTTLSTRDFLSIRYQADGSLDDSYDGDGKVVTAVSAFEDEAQAMLVQPDGKIMLVGYSRQPGNDLAIVRYNADASLDTTFDSDGIRFIELGNSLDYMFDMAIQPDDKIVAVGYSFDGTFRNITVVRYNPNGSFDTAFGSGGIVTTSLGSTASHADAVLIQSDGKILVGGNLNSFAGNSDFAVLRYNSDGSLDSSFGTNGVVTFGVGTSTDELKDIALQADGKIVAVGYSVSGGTNVFAVARIDAAGALDAGFGTGGKILTPITPNQSAAYSVAIQADGKIIVGGGGYNDSPTGVDFLLARYNPNGSLDSSFDGDGKLTTAFSGSSEDLANVVRVQPDGKIVAAGYTQTSFALARYNTDGTLDNSFNGTGKVVTSLDTNVFGTQIWDAIIQSNGKILAGGAVFTTDHLDSCLARYNADGTTDSSFGVGGIVKTQNGSRDNEFTNVALQSTGKIVAAGYSSANGLSPDFALVRYQGDSASSRRGVIDFDGDGKTDIGIFRPSDGSWWYTRSSANDFRVYSFGTSTDIITPGDFTGDGKTDISVFRPSTGEWFVQRSEDNSYFSFPFGTSGDIPAPADYDGDGKTDAAVFRPSSGTWFILNSGGSGTSIVNFGTAEDKPVPADFDGDGKADIAIFRPSDGSWWYLQSSNAQFKVYRFGVGTDKPVQGDYTGDGKADIAIFRPSTGEWFFQRSEDNSYFSVPFGQAGDVAAPGDYDGDGKFDTAVFRPGTADWFIQRSTAGILIMAFGTSGDRPIPNAYVP